MLDVIGTNYRDQELLAAHAAKPTRKIIGTENGHDRASWLAVRDNPPYAGQFLWTGIDYLGEARAWPTVGAGSGLFDRTDAPRPLAFQRQSWWSDAPMVRIARRVAPARRHARRSRLHAADPPHAGASRTGRPRDLTPHTENVEVYSNCAQVELTLNGRSLGSLPLPADASPRTWRVPFEPGTLRAIARNGAEIVATDELHTAGPPAKIVLAADQDALAPIWDDVAYVRATVTDAAGVPIPDAADMITFAVDRAGHDRRRGQRRHHQPRAVPGHPAPCLRGPVRRHPQSHGVIRPDHADGLGARPDVGLRHDPGGRAAGVKGP